MEWHLSQTLAVVVAIFLCAVGMVGALAMLGALRRMAGNFVSGTVDRYTLENCAERPVLMLLVRNRADAWRDAQARILAAEEKQAESRARTGRVAALIGAMPNEGVPEAVLRHALEDLLRVINSFESREQVEREVGADDVRILYQRCVRVMAHALFERLGIAAMYSTDLHRLHPGTVTSFLETYQVTADFEKGIEVRVPRSDVVAGLVFMINHFLAIY